MTEHFVIFLAFFPPFFQILKIFPVLEKRTLLFFVVLHFKNERKKMKYLENFLFLRKNLIFPHGRKMTKRQVIDEINILIGWLGYNILQIDKIGTKDFFYLHLKLNLTITEEKNMKSNCQDIHTLIIHM